MARKTGSFDLIVDYVRAELDGAGPSLEAWIDGLLKSTSGRQLLLCIAVDLQAAAVPAEIYEEAIKTLDTSNDPVLAFSGVLDSLESQGGRFCKSNFAAGVCKEEGEVTYARVLSMKAFIDYYAQSDLHTYTYDDVDTVREVYFDGEGSLEDSSGRSWRGSQSCVWVADIEELTNAMSGASSPGTVVNDLLGLGFGGGISASGEAEIVCVRYVNDIGTSFYQPTALDANWAGGDAGYFMTYFDRDSWGRTCRCTGGVGSRERVHPSIDSFQEIRSLLRTVYVGYSLKLNGKRSNVISEGVRRFQAGL